MLFCRYPNVEKGRLLNIQFPHMQGIHTTLQVLASGVHPSHDFEGNLLVGDRAKMAGKPISGWWPITKLQFQLGGVIAYFFYYCWTIYHIVTINDSNSPMLPKPIPTITSNHRHCTASQSSGGPAYCVEYRGDWKWQRECFGLSAHWGGVQFCHVCTAKGRGHHLGKNLNFDMAVSFTCFCSGDNFQKNKTNCFDMSFLHIFTKVDSIWTHLSKTKSW